MDTRSNKCKCIEENAVFCFEQLEENAAENPEIKDTRRSNKRKRIEGIAAAKLEKDAKKKIVSAEKISCVSTKPWFSAQQIEENIRTRFGDFSIGEKPLRRKPNIADFSIERKPLGFGVFSAREKLLGRKPTIADFCRVGKPLGRKMTLYHFSLDGRPLPPEREPTLANYAGFLMGGFDIQRMAHAANNPEQDAKNHQVLSLEEQILPLCNKVPLAEYRKWESGELEDISEEKANLFRAAGEELQSTVQIVPRRTISSLEMNRLCGHA